MLPRTLARRLLTLLAVLALAAGAAACGSGDDGGGSGGDAAAGGSDEQQVRAAVEGLYDDLGHYDAAGVCQRMSPTARKQIAQGAIGPKPAKRSSCEASFGKFLDMAKENGGLKRTLTAKVGKVEIDGDEALVTVGFDGQSGQIPVTKVDGAWKIGVVVATPSSPSPSKSK